MRKRYARYLLERPSGFYFRLRVPDDLRSRLGRTELRRSLNTRCIRTATRAAATLALQADALLHLLRMNKTLTDVLIRDLVRRYIDDALRRDEEERLVRGPVSLEGADHEAELLSLLADDRRDDLREANYHWVREDARALLTERGLATDPDDPLDVRLLRELLKAAAIVLEIQSRREHGDYEFEQTVLDRPIPASAAEAEAPGDDVRLSEAFARFVEAKAPIEGWRDDTIATYRAHVADFIELEGDLPLSAVGRPVVRAFRDALGRLPGRRKQLKAYRDLDVSTLLSMEIPAGARISPKTVQDRLVFLSGLFKWCVREGLMTENPAEGEAPKEKTTRREGYLAWSADELNTMFRHASFRGDARYGWQFWLPVISLFSGLRGNEIAQLGVADIREEDGIDFFDVREDDSGRHLKTRAATRRVPVHSLLLELGLSEHIAAIREARHDHLWPELASGPRGRPFDYPSKRFGVLFRTLGIGVAHRKVFHSFRKNFISALADADVATPRIAALAGHETGLITLDVYHGGFPLEELRRAVEAATYPGVDLSVLRAP